MYGWFKRGDLVWIPSKTRMLNSDFSDTVTFELPVIAMVSATIAEVEHFGVQVVYNSATYYVNSCDLRLLSKRGEDKKGEKKNAC